MADAASSINAAEPVATSSNAAAGDAGSSNIASASSSSSMATPGRKEFSRKDVVIEYAQPNTDPLVMKPNDPRLNMCDFFKKLQSVESDDQNQAAGDSDEATLPATITPVLMEHIRKWCAYHSMLNAESTDSEDEQLTEPERLVKEYLPDTKIPAFDEIFFQRMDMRTRLELMNAADFLGCDKLLDNLAKFIAKKMTRKTPQAIRRMFGIVETGLTEEDEKQWKEKFGWALIGCTDDVEEIDCVKLTPDQEAIVSAREARDKARGFGVPGPAPAADANEAGPSGSGSSAADGGESSKKTKSSKAKK